MTIEERMEKVEMELAHAKRRNRLLLAVVLMVALVMAIPIGKIVMTEGVGWGEKVVKANLFILVDENGKDRIVLGMLKDGPYLALYDENEKGRACLSVNKDEPFLVLSDENKEKRVGLSVNKDGPFLALFDENGKGRAILGTSQVTTPDGKVISYPESSLMLFDENGKVIWETLP